jgi:hypothetical protein
MLKERNQIEICNYKTFPNQPGQQPAGSGNHRNPRNGNNKEQQLCSSIRDRKNLVIAVRKVVCSGKGNCALSKKGRRKDFGSITGKRFMRASLDCALASFLPMSVKSNSLCFDIMHACRQACTHTGGSGLCFLIEKKRRR